MHREASEVLRKQSLMDIQSVSVGIFLQGWCGLVVVGVTGMQFSHNFSTHWQMRERKTERQGGDKNFWHGLETAWNIRESRGNNPPPPPAPNFVSSCLSVDARCWLEQNDNHICTQSHRPHSAFKIPRHTTGSDSFFLSFPQFPSHFQTVLT